MNFAFDEGQEELRAAARSFLADHSSSEHVRCAMESELGYDPELWKRILGPRELAWLETKTEADRAGFGMVVFSAKECFYKCQYRLTERFLGFHDVELELDPDSQRFVAKPLVDLGLADSLHFEGRWNRAEGHVITTMALQAR